MEPGKVDIIIVKFGNDELWEKVWGWARGQRQDGAVEAIYDWDNTPPAHNSGLVKARHHLERVGEAPFFVFMDYDFVEIDVDLRGMVEAMCDRGAPLCQPGDGTEGVRVATEVPCSFTVVHRDTFREAGGLDERYHTAYADWDLINRLGMPVQHNPSRVVGHIGTSNQDKRWKRRIWKADRAIYDQTWGPDPPAKWFKGRPSGSSARPLLGGAQP